jgi:hypothetical protein
MAVEGEGDCDAGGGAVEVFCSAARGDAAAGEAKPLSPLALLAFGLVTADGSSDAAAEDREDSAAVTFCIPLPPDCCCSAADCFLLLLAACCCLGLGGGLAPCSTLLVKGAASLGDALLIHSRVCVL